MERKKLAFDKDDVIADYFGPFRMHVNLTRGTNLTINDCICHNLAKAFGMSEAEIHVCQKEFEVHESIVGLPAVDGALDALNQLSKRFEIAIITSRKDVWREATDLWFSQNFRPVETHYANGRNNPFAGENGRMYKPQVAESIGAFCLIEDNEEEFIHWDSATVKPICFAQPWNLPLVSTHPEILRLDWKGITKYFLS